MQDNNLRGECHAHNKNNQKSELKHMDGHNYKTHCGLCCKRL
jgi:hypothetical protein